MEPDFLEPMAEEEAAIGQMEGQEQVEEVALEVMEAIAKMVIKVLEAAQEILVAALLCYMQVENSPWRVLSLVTVEMVEKVEILQVQDTSIRVAAEAVLAVEQSTSYTILLLLRIRQAYRLMGVLPVEFILVPPAAWAA